MDLLDRLLDHEIWTTHQLLEICATLSDEQLDQWSARHLSVAEERIQSVANKV